jgi:hypothetical protein
MSILGNEEFEDQTELWREKAITERALALIAAKEWPPPVRWIDDLLDRRCVPPSEDFWETVRREARPVRLVAKDGELIDD